MSRKTGGRKPRSRSGDGRVTSQDRDESRRREKRGVDPLPPPFVRPGRRKGQGGQGGESPENPQERGAKEPGDEKVRGGADAATATVDVLSRDVVSRSGLFARPTRSGVNPDPLLVDAIHTTEPSRESYGPPIDTSSPSPREVGLSHEVKDLKRQVFSALTERGVLAGGLEALKQIKEALSPHWLWKLWGEALLSYRSSFVDEYGFDPRYFDLVEPLLDFLYAKYFRVDVYGLSNIPSRGKAMLVVNHSGTLPIDGAILLHALKRDHRAHRHLRVLMEDLVFYFPFLGSMMNRIGGVRACQENAERLLDAGQLIGVFPEGVQGIGKPFKKRYQLQRFGRGGFVKLALRTQSPILPVAVVGAEESYPMIARVRWFRRSLDIPYLPITPLFPLLGPLGLLPLPSKWTIYIGEPIRLHERYGREAANDRLLVHRLGEGVRATIQEMLKDGLSQRESVFKG